MYRGVTSTRSQGSSGSLTAFPVTRGQESPVFSGTLGEKDEDDDDDDDVHDEEEEDDDRRETKTKRQRQKEGERERERGTTMPKGIFHPFEIQSPMTQGVVHRPAASPSSMSLSLSEMQNPRPHSRLTKSKPTFHQDPPVVWRHIKV